MEKEKVCISLCIVLRDKVIVLDTVYYRIRHTVREFSSLQSDVFKSSFIFIKALTIIGLFEINLLIHFAFFYIGRPN